MRVMKLSEMTRGWFVGNFQPTALVSEQCEVACQQYDSGDYEPSHYHAVATEVTLIVTGRVTMNGQEYETGDIIVIAPGESTDFAVLAPTITVVVKIPCVLGDKYLLTG